MPDVGVRLERPVEFVGSSRDDLSSFPPKVKDVMGFALWQIQRGKSHPDAKRMNGRLREAIEITAIDDTGSRTYRTVCTAKFGEVVYVLHAFQKKSKSGFSTPKHDLETIERRLAAAREHYEKNYAKQP